MAIPNHLPIDSTSLQLTSNHQLLTVQTAIINQIAQVARQTLVLDEVLHSIALQLHTTLQLSGCLIFKTLDQQLVSAINVATAQQPGNKASTQLLNVGNEFCQYYRSRLAQGQSVILSPSRKPLPPALQELAQEWGFCTILIVPMLHRSHIGGIMLYQCETQREWIHQDIAFVQAIADQCAIALTLVELEQRHQLELKKRQESELALKQTQGRLQAICNQTEQFIGFLAPDGTILEVNPRVLDFTGLTAQETLEYRFWEVKWWLPSSETTRQLQRIIAAAAVGTFVRYELDIRGKNDQVVTIDFTLKPQRDETGNVVLLVFEGQDITRYKQAQSALQASEARSRALLEAIPDLIFQVTRHGIYLDWKAAKHNTLPLQSKDIIGKHLHQVLPAEVAGLIWHYVELAIETNEVQIFEYQLKLNGKSQNVEVRIVKSGLDEAVAIVQDITERVQAQVLLQQVNQALEIRVAERTAALREANHTLRDEIAERQRVEEALRTSEERFRQAVVQAPFPIMIHAEDGEIIQINQVWTELTGYTLEEIPTIAQWAKKAYGQQQETVQTFIAGLYNLNDRVNEREFTVTTKDGTTKIWNFSSASLGQLTDGRRLIISMAADITERKRAEQQVQLLHSIKQALFESQDFYTALDVAIQKVCEATGWDFGEAWVPKADGSVLECSPAWFSRSKRLAPFRIASKTLTFAPGVGLPGRVWVSQQPEWRRDVSAEPNQVYLRSQTAREVGLKAGLGIPLRTPNGVIAVLVFYMFESREEDERLIELISASTELGLMIQRKQAEGEIRKALVREKELTELKSRFISMTSHEFRTPLTTILSSAELLERYSQKWSEEKKFTHLRRIQASVNHMTKLLNDILIIGKADAGKLEFNPAPLEVEKFCCNLVEELQLNDTHQHLINFRVSQGRVGERGSGRVGESSLSSLHPCLDEKLLRQILENLLSNAIKYSPPGSPVGFTLQYLEQSAIFEIHDQGIGIPTEDQERLFETFHRATNVGTIAGTGLGLAIVKKCVDIHQGQIAVESQVGVGTKFTVTLPTQNSLVP